MRELNIMNGVIKANVSDVKIIYSPSLQPQNTPLQQNTSKQQETSLLKQETVEQQNITPQQANCVNVEAAGTLNEVNECTNTPTDIAAITDAVVAKIPVVLAELTLRISMDTVITLPEPAIEIKQIKKRVKVTQCILIQDTNILFIKGFVRKNIDYATRDCSTTEGICGDLRHCAIDVPFSCTTSVVFNGTPPAPLATNTVAEFEYFRDEALSGSRFADKDRLLSGDISEFNQISTEFYNELPYCELVSSRIVEFDEYLDRRILPGITIPFEERFFDQIEEKMVVSLTLKLLQRRQVAINGVGVTSRRC